MEEAMERIRWGVIGAGGIADRRTIPGLLKAENAELVAVMEINNEFAESIRVKYNAKYAYDNEKRLLENPGIDAVYIASPVVFHAKQAIQAADAGKHILIEKPVAMTSKEGKEVLDYCKKKEVLIGAGLMMRFGTHIMTMKRAVAEGKIGTVVSGYSQFTLWLPPEKGNWRQDKSKSGGGCMMDMGVHCIDLIEYITGQRVTHVAAFNETVVFDYDVEDSSTVMMRLGNGAQCVVATNFNIPDEAAKWRLELFGTKGRLMGDTIIGQNDGGKLNAVFLDNVGAYDAVQDHADDDGIFLAGDFGNMYTREITSFSDSILNNKPLEAPASDAVHIQNIMEAAYRSNNELKIIKIDEPFSKSIGL
jgi:predicted dehydrogenase